MISPRAERVKNRTRTGQVERLVRPRQQWRVRARPAMRDLFRRHLGPLYLIRLTLRHRSERSGMSELDTRQKTCSIEPRGSRQRNRFDLGAGDTQIAGK